MRVEEVHGRIRETGGDNFEKQRNEEQTYEQSNAPQSSADPPTTEYFLAQLHKNTSVCTLYFPPTRFVWEIKNKNTCECIWRGAEWQKRSGSLAAELCPPLCPVKALKPLRRRSATSGWKNTSFVTFPYGLLKMNTLPLHMTKPAKVLQLKKPGGAEQSSEYKRDGLFSAMRSLK